jgi:hypothetical protein
VTRGLLPSRSPFSLPSVLNWIFWPPPEKIHGYATVFVWKNPAIRMSCVCISEYSEPKCDIPFKIFPFQHVRWNEEKSCCWFHRTVWVMKWHRHDNPIWYFSFPLDGFSWNLIIFWNSVEKIQVSVKSDKDKDTLHEHPYTFFITSRSIVPRMKDVSDKCCRENKLTFYVP